MADFHNNADFLGALREMGLSQYEAQVYLALIGEGGSDVATVIRKAAIPQNKAYEALASLERKGFAELLLGDRKRYRAIEPKQAYARYRREVEGALGQAELAMREIAAAAPRQPMPEPSIPGIRLISSERVAPVFEEKMNQANTELLIAVRAPVTRIGDVEAAKYARSAGLKAKWLIERAAIDDRKTGAKLLEWAKAIGNARVHDFVPLRMGVYDGRDCLLELRETDGSRFALLLPNPGLAEDMRALFLRLWSEAEPVSKLKPKRKSRSRK
jgi:sugar-specific transcriptional regulator TrmB